MNGNGFNPVAILVEGGIAENGHEAATILNKYVPKGVKSDKDQLLAWGKLYRAWRDLGSASAGSGQQRHARRTDRISNPPRREGCASVGIAAKLHAAGHCIPTKDVIMEELVIVAAICTAGSITSLVFLLMFCYCCSSWSGEQEDGEDDS